MESRVKEKSSRKSNKTGSDKKKRSQRIALVVLAMLAVLFIAGGLFLRSYIKPPSLDTDAEIADNRADGVYNVLVVGTDKVGLNTDTIMVLSLDTLNDKANVLSIPRDTMSNVTRKVKKINAAYSVGGKANIKQLKEEVRYLLGFDVDNYVIVNLDAFEQIIDAIGGVTIDVPRNMNYEDPYQNLSIHISKGLQTLNGKDAIGFVRYRKGYAEGDLGRVKAQQLFMEALAKQLATPATVSKLPKLANIVLDNMETDLTIGELLWFGQQGLELDMSTNLQMFILPGTPRYVNSLSYYIPNEQEILKIINANFNPYPTAITKLNVVNVNSLPKEPAVPKPQKPMEEESASEVEDEELTENPEQDGSLSPEQNGQTGTDGTGTQQPAPDGVWPPDGTGGNTGTTGTTGSDQTSTDLTPPGTTDNSGGTGAGGQTETNGPTGTEGTAGAGQPTTPTGTDGTAGATTPPAEPPVAPTVPQGTEQPVT